MYLSRLHRSGIRLDRNTAVPVWVHADCEKSGGAVLAARCPFVSRQGVGIDVYAVAAVPHLPCTGEAEQAETLCRNQLPLLPDCMCWLRKITG